MQIVLFGDILCSQLSFPSPQQTLASFLMCTEYPFTFRLLTRMVYTVSLDILFVLTMTYCHIELFNTGFVMSRYVPAL